MEQEAGVEAPWAGCSWKRLCSDLEGAPAVLGDAWLSVAA